MSDYKYKVGDRVKVMYHAEGEITRIGSYGVIDIDGTPFPTHFAGRVATVEVIEPEYEDGAMYVDADGDYFAYQPTWAEVNDRDRPWFEAGNETGLLRNYPTRPLRKLVPEGE